MIRIFLALFISITLLTSCSTTKEQFGKVVIGTPITHTFLFHNKTSPAAVLDIIFLKNGLIFKKSGFEMLKFTKQRFICNINFDITK